MPSLYNDPVARKEFFEASRPVGEELIAKKPSEILAIAIADARQAQQAGHLPDGGTWICPDQDGRCAYCLGGAVLIGRLQADKIGSGVQAFMCHRDMMYVLTFLDLVRRGDLTGGVRLLGHRQEKSKELWNAVVVKHGAAYLYKTPPMHQFDAFMVRMEEYRVLLQEVGL